MSPGRKVRAEGWAKAKPPRDKPGRANKFASKFGTSKFADRPTPMREDGPRRDEGDRLSPRRDAPPREASAPRTTRFGKPGAPRTDDRAPRDAERPTRSFGASARGRAGDDAPRGDAPRYAAKPAGDRPKRSFGDNARNRAAAPPRPPRDDADPRHAPRPAAVRSDERGEPTRPERGTRGADRHARPAAATLRPAYGAPRPVRDDATRPARPARAIDDRTTRPERTPRPARDDTARPVRLARAGTGKAAATDKVPNRAARRAELREAAPVAAPVAAPASAPARAAPAPSGDVPFLPGSGTREPQRIAKLLARAGIASRREIERMIDERRIALNGVPLETAATILTSLQGVTVDGNPVQAAAAARLFLFHKPPGVLTAERDFSGRPTIYDKLPEDLPRVMPVGRLDLNTEGLLLLTNDGEFKRKLELPSTGIPRVYRARAYGDITQAMLEDLSDGVEIEGIRYGPIDANLERRTGANVWIEMRITEGKNREVRRVLEYLGLQVSRLIRTAYGEFVLADLASGGIVEVRQNDLVAFRQTLR
jgi:23S rRNA pseudouridine2605 synthase